MSCSLRAFACLMLLMGGCAYQSDYVAPPDGRVRAVWLDNHVVVQPSGAPISAACEALLAWVSPSNRLRFIDDDRLIEGEPPLRPELQLELDSDFWIPRYWGPRLLRPPVALLQPPLFLPPRLLPGDVSLVAAKGLRHSGPTLGGGVRMVTVGVGSHASKPVDVLGVLAVLAAITLVALPAITLGLAGARPEGGDANAEAIDQVNWLNDWARTPGSPCAPDAVAGDAS